MTYLYLVLLKVPDGTPFLGIASNSYDECRRRNLKNGISSFENWNLSTLQPKFEYLHQNTTLIPVETQ